MTSTRPGYRFDQFFATRRIGALAPAPDGEQLLFVSDISGQFNLWRVSSQGGWPEQLTLYTEDVVRQATYNKDGSRIAFLADHHGDEKFQVFLMDAVGGWPNQITHRPDVQHALSAGAFSPCGRYLAYSANAANPQDVDIYLYDLTTGETRQLTDGGGLFYFGSFSPDGSQVLAVQFYGNTNQDLWLIETATGAKRNLTDHPGRQAKHFPGPWLKDGSGFYFTSNDGREFDAVGFVDLKTDSRSYVITAEWDVEGFAASGDRSLLAYAINEAGNSVLQVIERESGQPVQLPAVPKGVISAIAFAGADTRRRLFLQMSSYARATELYVLDLDQSTIRSVTPSMLGNIPDAVFVAPELVEITSHDGLKVPAWLYKPHTLDAGERAPVVLSIHGGPEAQERTSYNYGGFYQYLLSQGIAVLAPNIRGSTGFGIAYQMRIHRDWGGAELGDIRACHSYLAGLDWIDPARIAIWGGSFGGFATLSAATRLPELWAAACDFCGPANLITFVKSVPPHWKPMMKAWVGDPDEDVALLTERSPITYASQVQAPLMVVQGATDPRVVKAESDQMVEQIRSLGRAVEYLVFEDEGHGFAKRTNQLKGYGAMADFLIRHLLG